MKIAFFGSSLVSSYWNGAATYYRGLLRASPRAATTITFYEPDAFDRQQHRDIDPPTGPRSSSIRRREDGAARGRRRGGAAPTSSSRRAASACSTTCCSRASSPPSRPEAIRIFWDVDAPATLAELRGRSATTRCAALLPRSTSSSPMAAARRWSTPIEGFGAAALRADLQRARPDDPPSRSPPDPRFAADLAFLGNRLPDREARVERVLPRARGAAAGAPLPARRQRLGRQADAAPTSATSATSTRATTTPSTPRRSPCSTSPATAWPTIGFSPATRVFEAAGAGACLITDAWVGHRAVPGAGRGGARRARRRRGRRAPRSA